MSAPFELIFHDTNGMPEGRGFSRACEHYSIVPKDYESNLRFREKVYREGFCDPGFARAQKEICRKDPLYWLNTYAWTYDPRLTVKKIPFITFDVQDELIYELCRALGYYDMLIEKSRDEGASWLCLATIAHQFHFERGQQFSITSRVADLVDKRGDPDCLFWKLEYFLKNEPRWMRPGWTHTEMNLINHDRENTIKGESATGNVGRGGRNRAMFMDEFSAFNRDDGYKVLASSADNTRCRIFNGTPQGTGNAFYDVRENPTCKRFRIHWSEDPRKNAGLYLVDSKTGIVNFFDKTPEGRPIAPLTYPKDYHFVADEKGDGKVRSLWYDIECKRRIHKMLIAQELDIDYLSSSFQFFDSSHISLLKQTTATYPTHVGRIVFDPETFEFTRWEENPDGNIKLWIPLDDDGRPSYAIRAVVGGDISAGSGASNSCLNGVEISTGEKIMEISDPNIRPEPFGNLATAVGYWMNESHLIWEANGPGRQFGARVVENGYTNIFYRKNEDSIKHKTSDFPGWSSTQDKKYQLISEYRDALHEADFTNFSEAALNECLQYIQEPGPSVVHQAQKDSIDPTGARSGHGDLVIADALAWRGVRELRGGSRKQDKEADVTDPDEYASASSVGGRIRDSRKKKDSDGW